MAGLFPADELDILAYNRTVKDLNGLTDEAFFTAISENFIVSETTKTKPEQNREICMYLSGKWYHLRFAVEYIREPDPIERLDVTILQKYILEPVLGIDDPRTNERIGFVGGGRGTEELIKMVDSGETRVAFSLYPTTMDDLFAVSDMNEIMPPKSTWFEPKLKTVCSFTRSRRADVAGCGEQPALFFFKFHDSADPAFVYCSFTLGYKTVALKQDRIDPILFLRRSRDGHMNVSGLR